MRIGNLDSGDQVIVIAEIGNNHEGSFDVAREMVDRAAEAGVDAVKFQTFKTETFVAPSQVERFERMKGFELTQDQFGQLSERARAAGIKFISTPLDMPSAVFLDGVVDALKVASGDNTFYPLIEFVAGTDKPVIISTGFADEPEIALAAASVEKIRARRLNGPEMALLHCVSAYPVEPGDANLGAVQLNRGFTIDHCREAVKIVDADALYFHLNPLQEAVQPEGDTDFRNLAVKIRKVADALEVPVIVKEVGAGFSKADADLFHGSSVRHIDVAGTGGTSWSRIEHHRSEDPDDSLGLAFQDWGIPTPVALQTLAPYRDHFTLIASGGIRSGIDMAKAIVLGASLCGMASPFLKPATESVDAVIAVIERVRREFVTAMFLLGMCQVQMMVGNDLLLRPSGHRDG